MARLADRHPDNVDGAWFVDMRCIDCGTCRELVPDLFGETGMQSVVVAQPTDPAAEHRAWLASAACPTASIGRSPRTPRPEHLFPLAVDGPVSDLGHCSEDSFGATSYLVERPDGNLMVDSPVFTRRLIGEVDDRGGIAHVLLTHRDDVADAQQWAERYGARVWIHADDRRAAPYATDVIEGTATADIAPGVSVIPVPGHTRGSVVFLVDDRWLFTGDSLAWSYGHEDLVAFRGACWYSWPEQTRSLDRLADEARFEWVLPGHGARVHLDPDDAHARLRALVRRMQAAA
ncbi:MAG: MBL fold metallo-hydrolase [Acidimicrobiia bacterium]|nr:MBL fold metallo-hydrolase [Acidimicrobiia bacterium]